MFSYWIPLYSLLKPLAIPSSITTGSQSFFTKVVPASEMSWTFMNTLWGPLTIVLNGDILAIISVSYKFGDKIIRTIHKLPHLRLGDFFDLALLLAILVSGFLAIHHLPIRQVMDS